MRRAAKHGQQIGNIAETVRVGRFLDHVLINNPSSRRRFPRAAGGNCKVREDAARLGHENGAVARRLGEHPNEVYGADGVPLRAIRRPPRGEQAYRMAGRGGRRVQLRR